MDRGMKQPNFYRDQVLPGAAEVDRVLETEGFLAFHHTCPMYPTHIVVIPKLEIDSLFEFPDDPDILREMMEVLKKVAAKVIDQAGSCRIVTNLGGYQDSKHLHWHVISGDALR